MPRPELFHPGQIPSRFREWRAVNQARKEFLSWKFEHPGEAVILELMDVESKHRKVEIPWRAKLFEEARAARRKLGFGDQLAQYAKALPFRLEEKLLADNIELTQDEFQLLKQVNYGYWARVGYFTPGVRRLERLG